MSDHVYKSVELTGSSSKSVDDAVRNAISKAFEVTSVRGGIEQGEVAHWQATIKVGFTLDD